MNACNFRKCGSCRKPIVPPYKLFPFGETVICEKCYTDTRKVCIEKEKLEAGNDRVLVYTGDFLDCLGDYKHLGNLWIEKAQSSKNTSEKINYLQYSIQAYKMVKRIEGDPPKNKMDEFELQITLKERK